MSHVDLVICYSSFWENNLCNCDITQGCFLIDMKIR